LEIRSLNLAANLLEICLEDSNITLKKHVKKTYGNCFGWAAHILHSGQAFEKLREIIKAQGGNPNIDSEDLKPGKFKSEIKATKNGTIKKMDSKSITYIVKLLGAPKDHSAGIFLNKKIGEKIKKDETIFTLFSKKEYNLKEAKDSLINFPIIEY